MVESPGRGDEIQAIKAGLLEIADIVVVNKADLAQSDSTMSDLRQAISLRHGSKSPLLLKTIASSGEGVAELIENVCQFGYQLTKSERLTSKFEKMQKLVARNLGESVEREFRDADNEAISQLIWRIFVGELDIRQIAKRINASLVDFSEMQNK